MAAAANCLEMEATWKRVAGVIAVFHPGLIGGEHHGNGHEWKPFNRLPEKMGENEVA